MKDDYKELRKRVLEIMDKHQEENLHVQIEVRRRGTNRFWDTTETEISETKVLKVGILEAS